MLQHYVLIKYRENVSDTHVAEFCRRMKDLRGRVPGIDHLEIGRDILRDERSWDLILVMRFASVDVLRTYQRHPAHQELLAFNQPFVEDVASVDFE